MGCFFDGQQFTHKNADHSRCVFLLRVSLSVEMYKSRPVLFNEWCTFIYRNLNQIYDARERSICVKPFCMIHCSLITKMIIESIATEPSKWGTFVCGFLIAHLTAILVWVVLPQMAFTHAILPCSYLLRGILYSLRTVTYFFWNLGTFCFCRTLHEPRKQQEPEWHLRIILFYFPHAKERPILERSGEATGQRLMFS